MYQIWICTATTPRPVWTEIREGDPGTIAGIDGDRTLVITEQGQPSWVQRETLGRLYKRFKTSGKH